MRKYILHPTNNKLLRFVARLLVEMLVILLLTIGMTALTYLLSLVVILAVNGHGIIAQDYMSYLLGTLSYPIIQLIIIAVVSIRVAVHFLRALS